MCRNYSRAETIWGNTVYLNYYLSGAVCAVSVCLSVWVSVCLSVFLQKNFFRPKWIKFANSVNRHLEFSNSSPKGLKASLLQSNYQRPAKNIEIVWKVPLGIQILSDILYLVASHSQYYSDCEEEVQNYTKLRIHQCPHQSRVRNLRIFKVIQICSYSALPI